MSAAKAPKEEPIPLPASTPFDPANLPVRMMRAGGAKYLDVKYRLVWLREEHPDAAIQTEEKAHEPGQWATFRAVVSIPGGGSATGHGSETAKDFPDYYEKAETKALGRALAALGYGAQFLPDDGESLADAPAESGSGDRGSGLPEPIHAKANRRFHAIGSSHGWTDRALHLLGVGCYPKHDGQPTTSRSELTTSELDRLSLLMEKTIGRMVNQGTGEIVPTPAVEYANAIGRATDVATLNQIATALKEGGISLDWLKALWKAAQVEILAGTYPSKDATLERVDEAVDRAVTP